MEQEPEFGDPEAAATKADVRTAMRFVLGEIRHLRTWTEGRFSVIEERFKVIEERFKSLDEKFNAMDQKIEALRQEMRALISEGLRASDNRMLRYFMGFFAAQVAAFYALLRAV